MEQKWWNNGTSDGGTVQHLIVELWNRHNETVELRRWTAGLKCRSQVRLQATGHRSQATGQITGHTKNNRTLDKTVLD